jgi:hypothetical protein
MRRERWMSAILFRGRLGPQVHLARAADCLGMRWLLASLVVFLALAAPACADVRVRAA